MVWFNLKIAEHIAKYSPIKAIEKTYEMCDSNGNKLTYVKGTNIKGYYINDKGEKIDKAYFLIDNKPYDKPNKTKEVIKTKLTDINEIEDLIIEHKYLMICDSLLSNLKDSNKALKFGFSNGGKDSYIAYVYESKLYSGFLFMILGKSKVSDSVKPMIENIKEKEKAEQLNLNIQGINKLNIEIEL